MGARRELHGGSKKVGEIGGKRADGISGAFQSV